MTYRPFHPGFWPRFATTTRPYLAGVSASAGLVGLAIAEPAVPARAFWTAFGVFLVAYGLGQATTDVYQTDTDALSSPYRPLCRGELAKRDVLAVALGGLALAALALAVVCPATLVPAAVAVLGLLTYTPLKRRWWGGPLHNAWIVALLPLMGAMTGARVLAVLGDARVALAMTSTLLSYAVFVVLGYLKDVEADRRTGYETLPVRFGRRATVFVSAALGALSLVPSALLVSAFFARPYSWSLPGGVLWLLGAATLVLAHVRALGVRTDAEAHPAVSASVRAFVWLRLGEATVLQPSFTHGALGVVIGTEFLLAARPSRSQV